MDRIHRLAEVERSALGAEALDVCADGALTISEAVAFSGLSRSRLYELLRAGRLPYAFSLSSSNISTTSWFTRSGLA